MQVNFTIGDKEYKIPEVINLRRFERAIVWDIEDLKNLKPFVASLIDVPLMELHKLDEEVFHFLSGVCLFRIDVSQCQPREELNGYSLIDPDGFTFGQLIDLDTFISKSATQNASKIAAILYDAPIDEVEEWDVKEVWGAIQMVGKWREGVYREYDEFFELSEVEVDPQEARESNVQLMWYEAVLALADEKFIDIHKVVERPWREALNFLTWKKDKIQKQKLEILKKKHELQRKTR